MDINPSGDLDALRAELKRTSTSRRGTGKTTARPKRVAEPPVIAMPVAEPEVIETPPEPKVKAPPPPPPVVAAPIEPKMVEAPPPAPAPQAVAAAPIASAPQVKSESPVMGKIGLGISIAAFAASVAALFYAIGVSHSAKPQNLDAIAQIQQLTDNAAQQTALLQNQEKLLLRPYLYVEPAGPVVFAAHAPISVHIAVVNPSDTPAHDLKMTVNSDVLSYPLADTNWMAQPSQTLNSSIVFKNKSPFAVASTNGQPISQELYDQIVSGQKERFFAGGTVSYRDVFNDEHKMTYCYSFSGKDFSDVEPCANAGSNADN